MSGLFLSVLNRSITGACVALMVLAVRQCLRRYLPAGCICALWAAVWFRLLCPRTLRSPWSLLFISPEIVPENIGYMPVPAVTGGIGPLDAAISASLPAATPAGSVNPMQLLLAAAALVWCLGMAGMLGYGLICGLLLRIRIKRAAVATQEKGVFVAGGLKTPFVLGIFRPRICLPADLGERETSYVLLHERMHIRRMDHLFKPLSFLALCLHWFNPFAWLAFCLMGRDMETACDEAVLREAGAGIRKDYASALVSVASSHDSVRGVPPAFLEGSVKRRIRHVLNWRPRPVWMGALSLLLTAGLLLGLSLNPEDPASAISPEWLLRAWEWRTPWMGNASAMGNITDAWPALHDAAKDGFELYTDEEPYGARIRYRINPSSELTAEDMAVHYAAVLEENAGILFSLVENLDYLEIAFDGRMVCRFEREDYEEKYGILWERSQTPEDLAELYGEMTHRADTQPD